MGEPGSSCVEPAGGPMVDSPGDREGVEKAEPQQEAHIMTARVGQAAPGFEATAYIDGGFKNIKLSDYKGKWVTLCFYPGDFTFV